MNKLELALQDCIDTHGGTYPVQEIINYVRMMEKRKSDFIYSLDKDYNLVRISDHHYLKQFGHYRMVKIDKVQEVIDLLGLEKKG